MIGRSPGEQIAATSVAAGAASGVVGGWCAQPCHDTVEYSTVVIPDSLLWESIVPHKSQDAGMSTSDILTFLVN